MTLENKTCTTCKKLLLKSAFPPDPRSKAADGVLSRCRKCRNDYNRQQRISGHLRFGESLTSNCKAAKVRGYTPCSATKETIKVAFTGHCEICGVAEDACARRLHMDHSHETGIFRGWLCQDCNLGIGRLKDSVELLQAAIDYLAGNPGGAQTAQ